MSVLIPGATRTKPPKDYMSPVQRAEWIAGLEVDSWAASSGLPSHTQENTMRFRTYSTTEALRIMEHLTLVAKTPFTTHPAPDGVVIDAFQMTSLMLTIFNAWLERVCITVDRVS